MAWWFGGRWVPPAQTPPPSLPSLRIRPQVRDALLLNGLPVWLAYASYFFGGAFLANSVPHVVSGVTGRAFQSPFAKPPGKGLSSSTVNVLWGFFNVAVGYVLICRVGTFDLHDWEDVLAAILGALVMSVLLARTFGQFHGGNSVR